MKFTKENVFGLFGQYRRNQSGMFRIGDLEKAIMDLDDTPEKAVVPKCFDEWFKEICERGPLVDTRKQFALWKICQFGFGSYLQNVNGEDIKNCELSTWVSNNRMLAIDAVLNGYEVEKEPLYHVVNKDGVLMLFNKCDGVVGAPPSPASLTKDKYGHKPYYQLTEKEIKDYDERYWPFAVPVND